MTAFGNNSISKFSSTGTPISPVNGNELLRLYSDKAIAGYVLSGVPAPCWTDPLRDGESGSILVETVTH
jgi:hypothetical protein